MHLYFSFSPKEDCGHGPISNNDFDFLLTEKRFRYETEVFFPAVSAAETGNYHSNMSQQLQRNSPVKKQTYLYN